jgi:dTDP-4-amino-4,6-dideoxygalactose transaminase
MRVPYVDLVRQNASLEAEILEAVARVLRRGDLILGREVSSLESRLAQLLGVPYVVGVSSGTDALVLALRGLGIGPGDEVVTVSHSFLATAAAIVLAGATPVFVDIDPATMLMDPRALEAALTPRTRGVLPVHLNGFACPMDEILAFCRPRGLALVEDCAQALGTRYRERSVGSFGVGCFSLHPLKVLSACGDAGFVTTDDARLAGRLRELRNLGLRDRDHCAHVSGNHRLDTLQAAILEVKLSRLAEWLEARAAHARAYREALGDLLELPPQHPDCRPNDGVFVVRHDARDRLCRILRERGIDVKIHYPLAVHQQAPFAAYARRPLPATEDTVRRIFSLPVSAELSAVERDVVIGEVRRAVGEL